MSNLHWVIPFHWHNGQLRFIEIGVRRTLWPTLKSYEPGNWLSTPAFLRATKITSEKMLMGLDLAELDAEQRQPTSKQIVSHQFYGTTEIDVLIAPNTMFRVAPVRLYATSPDPTISVYLHLSAMLEKPILSSV